MNWRNIIVSNAKWTRVSILANDKLGNKDYASKEKVLLIKDDDDSSTEQENIFWWRNYQNLLCLLDPQLSTFYGKLSSVGEEYLITRGLLLTLEHWRVF